MFVTSNSAIPISAGPHVCERIDIIVESVNTNIQFNASQVYQEMFHDVPDTHFHGGKGSIDTISGRENEWLFTPETVTGLHGRKPW